jgi:hypothetical protein
MHYRHRINGSSAKKMTVLLLIIIAIMLFGAGSVTSAGLSIVGILLLSGSLAYLSIAMGWEPETTMFVVVTTIVDLGTLAFLIEEYRVKRVLEEIRNQKVAK